MSARHRTRSSSRAPEDGQEGRRGPARAASKAPGALAISAFVLLVLVVGAAGWASRNKQPSGGGQIEPAPQLEAPADPFADIADEDSPEKGAAGSRMRVTSLAPEGMLRDPVWRGALQLAEKAAGLADEAEGARKVGDTATFRAKAIEARDLFQKAIDATVQFETDCIEKYGETDRLVRQLVRARSLWISQRTKYRSIR